jgi:hypothetical protein
MNQVGNQSDTIRTMSSGGGVPVGGPGLASGDLLDRLMMLRRRSAYLGLLDGAGRPDPGESWWWLPSVVANLESRGVPAGAWWTKLTGLDEWRRLADADPGTRPSVQLVEVVTTPLAAAVDQINDQIEMSPQPAGEWAPVTRTLGEELLASLIGVSTSSVRRYAAGARATPQDVAERLHYLALLLADLAGSYNDFGMRRWFTRPRSQLGGRAPAELLGDFDPDGPDPAAAARLASTLVGAG